MGPVRDRLALVRCTGDALSTMCGKGKWRHERSENTVVLRTGQTTDSMKPSHTHTVYGETVSHTQCTFHLFRHSRISNYLIGDTEVFLSLLPRLQRIQVRLSGPASSSCEAPRIGAVVLVMAHHARRRLLLLVSVMYSDR